MATAHPAGLIPIDVISLHDGGMKTLNLIGRQVQKLRVAKLWSQKDLAEKLQLIGLDKSREAVGRIEARLVYVTDFEMLFIARALGVTWPELLPEIDMKRDLRDVITDLMKPRKSTAPKRRRRKVEQRGKPARR